MFLFDSTLFKEELKRHAPEMLRIFEKGVGAYAEVPEISIDYGIVEKSERVAVVPIDVEWSDMGSFDAIYEYLHKDESSNAVAGSEVIAVNSKGNLVVAERLTTLIDVENLLIIDTDDAMLVAKRGSAEKVKEVYNILKTKNDKRAIIHRTAFRPWGATQFWRRTTTRLSELQSNPARELACRDTITEASTGLS
jgi:mannose-1-phosphate guanylyltransferase/mannose-6-phosphate isomerase|nr:hypothetical protein [Archaeoglobus fulgidus]